MEISIFKEPVDDLLEVKVSLYEFTDKRGKTVDVSVWVKYQDSRSAMEAEARQKALVQLKRAITALEGGEV
ncbi:hypothetical protein P608_18545 [Comamonas thiooxydans]|uniref:Uncharacterized protein n=1 Tax=Comamonas thiooxydans TaxID=363952 RepID=A0A0E3BXH9_9BURK|nr:hypothetical protein [Comamonas thiooxydans]KGH08220.1 hypothetical protein P608_18545 [Comamonas thiooxydans]KGH14386.1 hypothetical protein P607_22975 [Comamonas thiooxydans]